MVKLTQEEIIEATQLQDYTMQPNIFATPKCINRKI